MPNADQREQVEASLLFTYQQGVRNYVSADQLPSRYRIDWLASMQHHGAPTRLLDFTRSPYVAAYFAAEEATEAEPCVVWAIDEGWCLAQAEKARVAAYFAPRMGGAHDMVNWLYLDDLLPPAKFATPAGPVQMTARQIAQQAAFMVPGDVRYSFEENLRAIGAPGDLREHVIRYQICGTWRGEVLSDLRQMNITRATLFGGPDGFAQWLKNALVDESPDSRRRRLSILGLKEAMARRTQESE